MIIIQELSRNIMQINIKTILYDNKDNLKVTELVEIQLLNHFELKLQTVGRSAREKNI